MNVTLIKVGGALESIVTPVEFAQIKVDVRVVVSDWTRRQFSEVSCTQSGNTLTILSVALKVTMVDQIESSESSVKSHVGLRQLSAHKVLSSVTEDPL